jgi:hypothetical protein
MRLGQNMPNDCLSGAFISVLRINGIESLLEFCMHLGRASNPSETCMACLSDHILLIEDEGPLHT